MSALNAAAKVALRQAGITQTAWAQECLPCNGSPGNLSTEIVRPAWLGDACGGPDDRCIGFHHYGADDCGCLPVLIGRYQRGGTPGGAQ
jgi:hypothetical protein